VFTFTNDPKNKDDAVLTSSLELNLLLRIALINNSASPAVHLLDLSTFLHLTYEAFNDNTMSTRLDLSEIQLDNQTKPLTYFPVVLTTDLTFIFSKAKYLEAEVKAKTIKLSVEEEFLNDTMAFLGEIKKFISPPSAK
jgi:hypothetical protein